MGFSAVARVTDDKWIACAVRDEINFGLKPGGELQLETTICNEIRQSGNEVVIDHVAEDPNFAAHHTPAMYGFQSYISMPIFRKSGEFFGTLCAIDPKPARLNNPETIKMFKLMADLIAFHLNVLDQLDHSASKLLEEQQTAELREQFIAILGHDLRNPVGAVLNVAQLLLRMPLDDRTKRLANILQDASYRMKALIDNILDFARGRLGDGIKLQLSDSEPVEQILGQVVDELRLIWPDRQIETNFNLDANVRCDAKRIAQMASNLVGNALSYSEDGSAVVMNVDSCNNEFKISVSNAGKQIPENIKSKLFQPFSRGEVAPNQQGLGLGLYISSEIAKAHGGKLQVNSEEHLTTFTFAMTVNKEVSKAI
ncbi:MAG: GAF domain-containing sensor histidine kinase [Mucilaginibacter sp.]|nr:GAF domain-containing sensor histidine kinase [Mucilaginibacter sp.]